MSGKVEYKRSFEVKFDVDVFVAGGGPAGVAAGVTAARLGKSVFIAESSGSFGGAATTMLIPAFMQFTNGVDFLAGGIGREVHDYLKDKCHPSFKPYCPNSIPVETLKLCYDEMVQDSGAGFMFHTSLIDVIADKGHIEYAVCAAKGEVFAVKAKIYIDGTGDGDLSALAGADFLYGEEGTGTVMGTTLCGLWTGMDWSRVKGPDSRELEKAIADGIFTNEDRHLPGMWRISENIGGSNAGHIYDINGASAASLTQGIVKARKQLLEYRRYYREYLDGFENAELVYSAPYLGIRETRRIVGDYTMTLADFDSRANFEDEIGRYSYPVDIHAGNSTSEAYQKFAREHQNMRYKNGESYGIPYRCLVPKGMDNLLVAGRCVSTDRFMQSSIRVMPGCYITGMAAGAASSVIIEDGSDIHNPDIRKIQSVLKDNGAFLPRF
ncbi:MAG: FAD-dependent oxidoreductase [Eubacteriales bacterium]